MIARVNASMFISSALMLIAIDSFGAGDVPRRITSPRVDYVVILPEDPGSYERALRESKKERRRYRGIDVKVHPRAFGAQLDLQWQIAALMNRLDFVPAVRIRHFNWAFEPPGTVVSWNGRIQENMPVAGGYLVKVLVSPVLMGSNKAVVDDCIEEHYLFDGARLHFLGVFEDNTPKVTTFN